MSTPTNCRAGEKRREYASAVIVAAIFFWWADLHSRVCSKKRLRIVVTNSFVCAQNSASQNSKSVLEVVSADEIYLHTNTTVSQIDAKTVEKSSQSILLFSQQGFEVVREKWPPRDVLHLEKNKVFHRMLCNNVSVYEHPFQIFHFLRLLWVASATNFFLRTLQLHCK
jgi:hypothetical protein